MRSGTRSVAKPNASPWRSRRVGRKRRHRYWIRMSSVSLSATWPRHGCPDGRSWKPCTANVMPTNLTAYGIVTGSAAAISVAPLAPCWQPGHAPMVWVPETLAASVPETLAVVAGRNAVVREHLLSQRRPFGEAALGATGCTEP